MSDIEKLPREYPEVDSRLSFEQEQNAQDILARKGINIDWTTGTIQAKNFVGSGTGLWDVGEGTGTGPKGDKGDPGTDGKDFKYTDFTQEQLEDLTGPKGDPFVYNDFTPSQLADLKGPPGKDGEDYDPTVLDNLNQKVDKNTADVSTNRADIAKEVVRNDEQDATLVDLQDQLDNIEIPEPDLEGLATEEYVQAELDASQNLQDIEIAKKQDIGVSYTKDEANTLLDKKANVGDSYLKAETYSNTQIDTKLADKASISQDNTFNGKQVFNKNLTLKGAETALIPTLSSRWHKFSVNPPKNEDGTNNTSDPYGVNYYIDTGNTWKNQFKISNRKGAAFEVKGGEYPQGLLHMNWLYTGEQSQDNNIATVKYVNTAISGIEIPEPDLSNYMTTDETVDFVDQMDRISLATAKAEAMTADRDYAVPLVGNTVKTGNLVLKTDATTPFEIKEADGTPVFTMWKSGAVALEKPYESFKDNELVTKAYVDSKVSSDSGSTGFAPVSEYDYYYLDMEGTSAGRITLCDGNGARTGNLKIIRAIIFNGVDANGKRWARDKDAVSYEKLYTGVASLMTEEGKVVATVGSSGKSTGFSTLHYYKDAVPGFISADTYILEIANSEGLAVTSNITEITYPQKLHLHVSGLHF